MPLTFAEIQSLIAALGVNIPADILAQKAKAEEFKKRREKITADATGKPADWWLGTKFDDALKRATEAAGRKELDSALALLGEAAQLLQQPEAPPLPTEDGPATTVEAALAGWQGARSAAVAQLKKLGDAIKGFAHPQSQEAFILVKAIQANLTAKPETLQSVSELEQYLESDRIITEAEAPNGFGITIDLRKPLLGALGKLKPLLSGVNSELSRPGQLRSQD